MGPKEYTLRLERKGDHILVKRVLRPEQLPPGGKLLYREDERLYILPHRADCGESLAWQGYFLQEGDRILTLWVWFGGRTPVSGWHEKPTAR